MDDTTQHTLGNSTKAALVKLRDDIRSVVDEYKKKNPTGFGLVKNIISFSSEKVLLSGVAYTVILIYIVCLILTYLLGDSVQAHSCLLWEALFLFVILVVNFLVAFNEEYLYRNEIPHRVQKVIENLDESIEEAKWKEEHYPHLCAPFSPCVILQWTYRDATIVNLPWALLVEGDIIVLRPGQEVPGHCKGLQPEDPELYFGQIFQPTSQPKENFNNPRIRTPHQNKAYRMCETPYIKNLKVALDQATSRPVTIFEKQRYLCTVKIMEGIVLPLVIAVVVIASFVRHVYHLPGVTHWTEIYFLQTIAASLPLLQIVFPIVWVTLNCYGLARFKLLSETRQKYVRPKSCSISEEASDPLIQALSETNLKPESLKTLAKTFFNILTGREDMVCRTANIVHVLGSLSALCCIDKKGILSWPNPTAEKVFFLRNSSPASNNSSKTSLVGSMGRDQSETTLDQIGDKKQTNEPSTIAEVLDLTHDQNAPFCVEFDDQRWRHHLARLKPLGLAALLNTCAPAPRHTYAHFCAHLTCEAQLSEDLVPVTNRRCLCELAKQIGFTDSVADSYTVQDCLAVFRHLQADTIRRETRFVRQLHLSTRVKVPLPHMLAVLVKDQANQLQMLTQGTADIILDSCADYWNGRDLTPISPSDRKKIIDFYQRNSLTAYCTAFAYKPLTRGICPSLAHSYLELPADSRALYAPHEQQWPDAPALHFHSTGQTPQTIKCHPGPLTRGICPSLAHSYLELPADSRALYAPHEQQWPDAPALHFHSTGQTPQTIKCHPGPLTRGICPSLAHSYLELPADSRALYAPHEQQWPDAPALHFHSTGQTPQTIKGHPGPLTRGICPSLAHSYLELPADSRALYAPHEQQWPDAPALHFHSTGQTPQTIKGHPGPLTRGICPSLAHSYLELPADSRALYAPHEQQWPDAPALHFHSTGQTPQTIKCHPGPLTRGICPSLAHSYLELPADSRALYAPHEQQWPDAPALHFHSTGQTPQTIKGHPGPLTRGICPSLAHSYLELPADSRALYAPHEQQWPDAPALHFHSTDSLLFNEVTDDDVNDAEGYFDMQCNQVFIGMVTMQYQAQSDMVELIERLERACIRFVHFSKENELRSRVFSEKMGLESGWNCHISLMSDESASKGGSPLSSQTLGQAGRSLASRLTRAIDTYDAPQAFYYSSNNMAASKALSLSAPGAINLDHATVKFDNEIKKARHSITTHSGIKLQRGSIPTSQPSADSLLEDENGGAESPPDACRSLSCLTDSTDHSAPVNFDMSNRAKLPRGIENIRPHIEQVDNVPLLVSLFTDCTPNSVHLMIQIMQDYGEVVCVMGSAANCLNMEIFMQADASIAVEPLYPVLCQKMPPYQVPARCAGPIDLARSLNSVPCSLSDPTSLSDGLVSHGRDEMPLLLASLPWHSNEMHYAILLMTCDSDVSLFTLITMSRHYMMCLWNSTQFWICSVCFIALLQVGSLCAFLPPALSVGGAAWCSAVCVPLLAAPLASAPPAPGVMQRAATRPHLRFTAQMALFVFWCYACKFLPAAISILVVYGFTLRAFCEQIAAATNATGCWIVYPVNAGNYSDTNDLSLKSFHGWGDDFYDGFYLAQHITLALITLHLIVISLSFVHRQSSIWQRGFWTNKVWSASVVILVMMQCVFSAALLSARYGRCERWELCALRYSVPWPLATAYVASPLLAFALNEFIKWQEIKADVRNQRRARLDFGTKLGMNSPF